MTSNGTSSSLTERNIEGNCTITNTKMKRPKKPRCKLDSNDCVNLKDILFSFNGPISQEQAWALCYQAAKAFLNLSQNEFCELSDMSHILLHKDGHVRMDFDKVSNTSPVPEQQLVFSLGMVIFNALDFGLDEEEERPLSPDLETLITLMTSNNTTECQPDVEEERLQETDDEGIERDSGESELDDLLVQNSSGLYKNNLKFCSLQNVMHICARHLGNNEQADAHYQAVIRAFVAEALELSQFLEKVAYEKQRTSFRDSVTGDATKYCDTVCELDALDFTDWARFWVQVIGELRRGVKLKKVEDDLGRRNSLRGLGKGAEFELTPYEILMDDIRQRRYHLRKAPEPSFHLRKDARAVILDFIRSRPPLKKASERKLAPLKKEATLRELLMESIKKPPKPLRSTRIHDSPIVEMPLKRVGGESRRIVLGEVPPARAEQEHEQEPAQDVAAQWLHQENTQEKNDNSGSTSNEPKAKIPVPQPRSRIGKPEETKFFGIRNRKSRRRLIRGAAYAQDESKIETSPKASRRGLTDGNSTSRHSKKLIPVDFDFKLDGEEDDDDDYDFEVTKFDDDDDDDDDSTSFWHAKEHHALGKGKLTTNLCDDSHEEDEDTDSANPWRKTGGLRLTKHEYHRFCDAQLESYDLATQCPSRRASARKHATRGNSLVLPSNSGTTSLPHSRPHSRQQAGAAGASLSPGRPSPNLSLNASPSISPQPRTRPTPKPRGSLDNDLHSDMKDWEKQTVQDQKPSLNDMFLDDRLSLTLEEIVHIRSVLTKAELESLPVEGRVKEDVEKRRVCFLCLKTRFGILGPWGQRCRLCERTVCVKCYTKMRIPTEHFSHVPVVLLSPGLLLSPTSSEPDSGKNSWLRPSGAIGSAPASPAARRRDFALRSGTPSSPLVTPSALSTADSTPTSYVKSEYPHSSEKRRFKPTGSPAKLSTTATFGSLSGLSPEQRLIAERLRGVSMVVCHDCRIMVIQIIKSSRNTRATIRNNVISRLTLNLSPAYV